MTNEEEVNDMPTQVHGDLGPIINDINNKVTSHAEKITRLETQNENIFTKLESMETKVDGIGSKIDESNEKNEQIFNKLLEHHLGIETSNNTNRWKFLITGVGAGGVITGVVAALLNFVLGG